MLAKSYGVVDLRKNWGDPPRYSVVDLDEEEARRFNWGASCDGWMPVGTFPTQAEADEYVETLLKEEQE